MNDEKQFKVDKAAINAANSSAHTLSKDAGVKGQKAAADETTGARTPAPKTLAGVPCPRCGKITLRAEFPDQYETWIKCSSCSFFLGMSHDDWHRMENSPNISEKIKKMAVTKGIL